MRHVMVVLAIAALAAVHAAPAVAQDDAVITKGKSVFAAQKCAMCHAVEGKGNKNMPLDGIGGRMSADDIRKWIVSPRDMKADTKMKAYPSLTAGDLDNLVAYLASLKK